MTQDKLRKIITASVVACTSLLVFLFIVLVYQWIAIGVENRRIDNVQKDIDALTAQVSENGELAEYYENQGRFWLALEQGWIKAE